MLPAQDRQRIVGYDLSRGVAIFAMVIINFDAIFCTQSLGSSLLADFIDFINRRAAAMLVIVAGVGMTLLSKRRIEEGRVVIQPGTRTTLFKRACFLLIAGYLLRLTWQGDILHYYGIFILTGLCFLPVSNAGVLLFALIFWLASLVQFFPFFEDLGPNPFDNPVFNEMMDILFTGYYPFFPWCGYLFIGIWLGRQYERVNRIWNQFFLAAFTLFTGAELISFGVEKITILLTESPNALSGWIPSLARQLTEWTTIDLTVPTPMAFISALGSGLGVILLCIKASTKLPNKWRVFWTAAGSTSLTLYVFHILFVFDFLLFLGFSTRQNPASSLTAAILFFALYSVAAQKWIAVHKKGPLEKIMRAFPFIRLRFNK